MVKLRQTYGLESPIQSAYPMPIIASRAPTTSDKNFTRGQLWVDKSANQIYSLTNVASASATWLLLASSTPTSGDFTTVTASGDIETTGGDVIISGAAQQLQVEGGAATDFIGQATLVSGEATVLNTNIAAGDRVFVTRSAINASTALGHLLVTINAGVSFVIEAKDAATPANDETGDLSTIDYFIVRQL